MLKPRLASLTFLLLSVASFVVSYQVITRIHADLVAVAVFTMIASVVASYFSLFGIIASFLGKPTSDGYFLPKDNAFVRFCIKIRFLDLSEETSFCGYSATLAVGSFIALAVIGVVALFGLAFLHDPMKTLETIGKLILCACAVVGGVVVYCISFCYFFKRAPWVATLITFSLFGGLIYVATKERPPETVDLVMLGACIGSFVSIIVTGLFGYRFLRRLSFYSSICPKYEPVSE